MSKLWVVYKHTDPEGKVYIGITCVVPEHRWSNGMKYNDQPVFFRAIIKHGWKNIKHEIVAQGLDFEAACEMEKRLIAEYNSTDRKFGYNVTPGGLSPAPYKDRKMSDEKKEISRRLRSEAMKQKWKDPTFRERTVNALRESAKRPEYRKRVSDGLKAALQNKELIETRRNTMKRRLDNPEFRKKCIDSLAKSQEKIKRRVVCLNTGKTYSSLADASRDTGVSVYSIYKSAKHITKNPKMRWEYVCEAEAENEPRQKDVQTEQMLMGVMETDSKARAVTVNGHKYSLYEWCKMFESCGGGSVQAVYYRWSRGERDPYRLVGVEPTKPFTQEDLDWLRETRPYRKGQEDEWEIACDLIGQPHIMASVLKDAIKAEDAKNPL